MHLSLSCRLSPAHGTVDHRLPYSEGENIINANEFPLTWAQHWPWVAQHETPAPPSLTMHITIPVPDGEVSVADIEQAVRWLGWRHEALRTKFRVNSDGYPVQTIEESFEPVIKIIESNSTLGPKEVEDAISEIYSRFELEEEPPIRVAILTVNRIPKSLHLAVHHIACDRDAAEIVRSDIIEYLEHSMASKEPNFSPPRWSALQQHGFETSPRGEGISQRALNYWRSLQERQPYDLPPVRFGRHSNSGCTVKLRSDELGKLCTSISRREGCFPTAVLITAFAASFSNVTGRDISLFSPVISNRHLPNSKGCVSNLIQLGRLVVDFGRFPAFRAALKDVMESTVNAIRHGRYNPSTLCMERIAAGITAEGVLFNYFTRRKGATPPDARSRTIEYSHPVENEIVVVNNQGCLDIFMRVSHDLMSTSQAESVLTGLPVLLEQFWRDSEVQRPDFRGVLPRWRAPEGWVDWRGRWIYKHDLETTLEEFPGVQKSKVLTEGSDRRVERLLGCIVGSAAVTPGALREYLLGAKHLPGASVVPDEFIIRQNVPLDMGSIDSWLATGIFSRGDGRDGDDEGDAKEKGPAEVAILRSFLRVHPGARPRLSLSYAESGGEYTKIPAMIDGLRDIGYEGLSVYDLMDTLTLRKLAEMLTPHDACCG